MTRFTPNAADSITREEERKVKFIPPSEEAAVLLKAAKPGAILYKGREIEFGRVSGDYEEPLLESAGYVDGAMEALTEEELDEVQELYASELSDEAYQNMIVAAEYACEGDR